MTTIKALIRRAAVALAVAVVSIAALGAMSADDVQAAGAPPVDATVELAPQAAPDEGGTGVNNFKREEWFEFSVMLGPFLVLVTFILILIFKWDSHSRKEEED